jgi:hypothetical protein
MEVPVWTWGGAHFGYRDDDDLWTYAGRRVGRFHGSEVFGEDGRYLGEVRDGDRLVTKILRKEQRKGVLSPRHRAVRRRRETRPAHGMLAGYEDFPSPEAFP